MSSPHQNASRLTRLVIALELFTGLKELALLASALATVAASGLITAISAIRLNASPFWATVVFICLFVLLALALLVLLHFLPSATPKTDFYSNRNKLNQIRGGIEKELNDARRLWVSWLAGSQAVHQSQTYWKKIDRMLLRHPSAHEIPLFIKVAGMTRQGAIDDIVQTTMAAQRNGIPIRWLNPEWPAVSMVFADPDTPGGWVRLEFTSPYLRASEWPSVVIHKAEYPDAFAALESLYNAMWTTSDVPDPAILSSSVL